MALAHFGYLARALNTTAITIGGTLLTDDALQHERTPYSILVVFTTTTATEPKLGSGNCGKRKTPLPITGGLCYDLTPSYEPHCHNTTTPSRDFCERITPMLGHSL